MACGYTVPIFCPFLPRVESLEALPILSRNPSRSTDRDWETASAASSLASVAEYTGDSYMPSLEDVLHRAVNFGVVLFKICL